MNRPWAALGLVLALCVIMPRSAQAQGRRPKPTIGQNYPNPFNPETKADFSVGEPPTCPDGPSKQYKVTAKVYNVIGQVVAIPVLFGGPSGQGGTPLTNLPLTCGSYKLRWDGKTLQGREAASGIYRIVIDQDGVKVSIQAVVGK